MTCIIRAIEFIDLSCGKSRFRDEHGGVSGPTVAGCLLAGMVKSHKRLLAVFFARWKCFRRGNMVIQNPCRKVGRRAFYFAEHKKYIMSSYSCYAPLGQEVVDLADIMAYIRR
jgi:hypothetical protein